jgi:nucleoside triphosphatase
VASRIIVVGLVQDRQGRVLLCKMPPDRGVFPGQWGLPGGGIEAGERMEAALHRELREELGIEIAAIQPLFFSDGQYNKMFPHGSQREIYMIFLIFACQPAGGEIRLGPEFSEFAWVAADLAVRSQFATRQTLHRPGCWNRNRL